MPTLPLRNIGLQGLQKDALEQDIPATGITTGTNVRIKDRSLQSWGDVDSIITVLSTENLLFADQIWREEDLLSGIIVILSDDLVGQFEASEFEADQFLVSGEVRIYFYDTTGTRTEIGPASPMQTVETWYGAKNAETYIINNGKADLPHVWDTTDVSDEAVEIMPGWPTEYKCSFMEGFKNFLVAGDISVSGNDVFGLVKWSHPRSPADATFFWDFTDPTLLAGENPLAVDGRKMVAIQPLKDLLMIYFDRLVYRMQFVGGQFVMSFDVAFTDDGAVSARSMVEVNGSAYVFGLNDVYVHDGFVKKSVSDLRMTRYLQNNINPEKAIDVVFWPINNELLFLVRTPASEVPIDGDRIFVYNMLHDAWTEAEVTDTDEPAIGLLFTGPKIITGSVTETWDVFAGNWDDQGQLNWAGTFNSADRDTLYAMSLLNNVIYDFDAPSGSDLFRQDLTLIQHTHIDLDDSGEAVGDRTIYVNRAYPQLRGDGTVQFRFGVHQTAQGPVDWVETVEFKINKIDEQDDTEEDADYACDIRLAGRYLAYELKPLNGAEFAFSGMDLEVDQAGEV